MNTSNTLSVSALQSHDKPAWQQLYNAYAAFYKMPMDEKTLDTIWQWIFDDNNPFYCLIAKDQNGEAVGLAHCRAMPSPLRGAYVGFLDDLFVTPDCRGSGCVQALYKGLNDLGKQKGWPFIRWITAENNYRGRASYDKVADKTHWLTYQMPVE